MDIQIIQSLDENIIKEATQNKRVVNSSTPKFSEVLEDATKATAALAVDSLVAASQTGAVDVAKIQAFFDQHGININLTDTNSVASALKTGATVFSNVANTISDNTGTLACSEEMNKFFEEAAETFGVDVKLLKSIAKQESNFVANAVSKAGAVGVMQLMPTTATSLGVTDSYDAYQNIMGGAKYISSLLTKYNGDVSLALAAYNAGSGNVAKYGGIPPFTETQNYVQKVLNYYNS